MVNKAKHKLCKTDDCNNEFFGWGDYCKDCHKEIRKQIITKSNQAREGEKRKIEQIRKENIDKLKKEAEMMW